MTSSQYVLQQLLNALMLGGIYGLVAIGYTMVYGVLSMINFAHGDIFMLGAFFCFLAAHFLSAPLGVALLIAMTGGALVAALIERVAYRPLRKAPRVSAIITALGIGIFLESVVLSISPRPQLIPTLFHGPVWEKGGVSVSSVHVLILGIAIVLMLVLDCLVHRTRTGMAMRAISVDPTSVWLMGVPVNRIITITFAIGGALAGAAGTLYGLAYQVIDPYMGIMVGWKAFICAVIGGVGNIRGAMLGAWILAALEVFVAAYFSSTYRDLVVFTLLILLLVFRPQGLLGRPKLVKV